MSVTQQKYQTFATSLEALREYTTTAGVDAPKLRQRAASLQEFYQQQILPLANQDTESQNQGRILSLQTEISKQLRLLELDVTFFAGARVATTAQARLQTIENRITTLLRYCNAILENL
ncbi:MAG: heterocyst frequency control protein PatD [Nostocaceae cyanobacterium]|nr:heterocyst frequency control protein PatD [Nostocaceae cyanobacterium]